MTTPVAKLRKQQADSSPGSEWTVDLDCAEARLWLALFDAATLADDHWDWLMRKGALTREEEEPIRRVRAALTALGESR